MTPNEIKALQTSPLVAALARAATNSGESPDDAVLLVFAADLGLSVGGRPNFSCPRIAQRIQRRWGEAARNDARCRGVLVEKVRVATLQAVDRQVGGVAAIRLVLFVHS
jgi:hypothetical protein